MPTTNQYIIVRNDLDVDPITIVSEGILIGRLLACEVPLNHPSVSRVQAGIRQFDDDYYIFSLRPNNLLTLNGKPLEDNEALAAGDIIKVGPFQLEIESTEEALVIRVELLIGTPPSEIDVSDAGLTTGQLDYPTPKKPRPTPRAASKAVDVFWRERVGEAVKMVRPPPLFPKSRIRSGREQSLWTPTTDLKRRWPVAFFIWAAVGVGVVTVATAFWYTNAFAPAPLSISHTANQLSIVPAIATNANAGSCTSCHSWTGIMEQRCAACHNTEAFVATVIKQHDAAGIGCVDCHAEHKGAGFSATAGALASCTQCHTDTNQQVYNGRKVATPHGGTFGYPVVNGSWNAKSINDEGWDLRELGVARQPGDTDEKWRSNQFHALHDQRVRVAGGLKGNSEGRLSCSSCHNSFDPIDRTTPRTTCATCHNTNDQPNCTSCHVQHIKDTRRWANSML